MGALLVRIAVAVVVGGCATSSEVEALLAPGDATVVTVTGAGGSGEAGIGGEAGEAGSAAGEGGNGGDGGSGGSGGDAGFGVDAGGASDGTAPVPRDASDEPVSASVTDASDSGDGGEAGAPKSIRCGAATCDYATEYCCAERPVYYCLKKTQTAGCPRYVERLHCDERSDCPTGQSCCLATVWSEQRDDATCAADCSSGLRLCDLARGAGCDTTSTCEQSLVQSFGYCRRP